MRFDYVKERVDGQPKKQWPKRAKLPVTLFYNGRRQNMYALVDSGADECLFHSGIAGRLGIDVKSGLLKKFGGITGSIDAYMHVIQLEVQNVPHRVTVLAGFTDAEGVSGILGQSGFFENFKITFERYEWEFDVTPRA